MINKRIPCKKQILTLLQETPNWINKEEFAKIIKDFSPETVNRELRILSEIDPFTKNSVINKDHYKGANGQELTRYSINAQPIPKVIRKEPEIKMIDGRMIAVFN